MTDVEKNLPHWAHKLVDAKGLERIREAVDRVEKRTSAEIVPMLVRSSHPAGHVPVVLFLVLLLGAWSVMPVWLAFVPEWPIWIWEAASLLFAAAVSFLLKDLPVFHRWFTPRADQALSVERRALLEFHLGHMDTTENRTGVLIMASLHERRAVVLADRAIDQQVSGNAWQTAIEILLTKTHGGDFTGGMVAAIELLGELLEPRFPAGPDKKDQLADGLVIKA